jgi:hypothetical protein
MGEGSVFTFSLVVEGGARLSPFYSMLELIYLQWNINGL